MRCVRRAGCGNPRSGFTLVELVTSAALMTIIMLGVVQVFGIITRTASEAEGIHFAQQQGRALLDRLHNDLRGMTREGYLRIVSTQGTDPTVPSSPPYHRDTLAFVTVGRCASTFADQPYEGTAAEVVYTNNVRTPNNVLRLEPGGAARSVDARRGILARGQWIMAGGSSPGAAHDLQDASVPTYLCGMFENQQRTKGAGGSDDRVTKQGEHVRVDPWTASEGLPQHPDTLKRVMASCVSEFYVETFDPEAGGGGPVAGQPQGPSSGANFFRSLPGTYTWSGPSAAAAGIIYTWPQAIRVTVAVHDPADASPPERYRDGTLKPFRGFVLQEVFWLTDP